MLGTAADGKVRDRAVVVLGNDVIGNKGVHELWRQNIACIFDVRVLYIEFEKYRGVQQRKILEKQEKQKKLKYQKCCWEMSWDFEKLV